MRCVLAMSMFLLWCIYACLFRLLSLSDCHYILASISIFWPQSQSEPCVFHHFLSYPDKKLLFGCNICAVIYSLSKKVLWSIMPYTISVSAPCMDCSCSYTDPPIKCLSLLSWLCYWPLLSSVTIFHDFVDHFIRKTSFSKSTRYKYLCDSKSPPLLCPLMSNLVSFDSSSHAVWSTLVSLCLVFISSSFLLQMRWCILHKSSMFCVALSSVLTRVYFQISSKRRKVSCQWLQCKS